MTYNEVDDLSYSKKEPIIRKIVAAAFRNASYDGDYKDIEPYLKILFGRPVPFIPKTPSEDKPSESIK